jgi:hypothetical protein
MASPLLYSPLNRKLNEFRFVTIYPLTTCEPIWYADQHPYGRKTAAGNPSICMAGYVCYNVFLYGKYLLNGFGEGYTYLSLSHVEYLMLHLAYGQVIAPCSFMCSFM